MNKALLVGAGILISRLAGLVRLRAFAHYFGLQSDAADAFNAAFRIPNVLQNLFGEGALSGSFIPVYAGLLAHGDREEADRVASAVGALLALVVSILVALGVVATPVLIAVIAPGFTGDKRELTVSIVRILFPGTGLLVLSAWCLGILNSHHKFLLSYTAPVVWNAAMIATLIAFGPTTPPPRLAVLLAWGSVGGSLLQFAVQLPAVARVARIAVDLGHDLRARADHRRQLRAGVHQPRRRAGQRVYRYRARQPAADRRRDGTVQRAADLHAARQPVRHVDRCGGAAGDVRRGRGRSARRARWCVRGLARRCARWHFWSSRRRWPFSRSATSWPRRCSRPVDSPRAMPATSGASWPAPRSACWRPRLAGCTRRPTMRLRDTRTPLRFAMVRVALTTALGYLFAIPLPRWLGVPPLWGAAGLTASAGIAGWVEMLMLRRVLNARIGWTGLAVTLHRPTVVRGWTRCRRRLGHPIGRPSVAPSCDGRAGAGSVRHRVLRGGIGVRPARSGRGVRSFHAAALTRFGKSTSPGNWAVDHRR